MKTWFSLALAICLLLPIRLRGDEKSLKHDLEQALVGRTVVSRIVFGGKAIPRDCQGCSAFQVNTIVYPDAEDVTYRVEWLSIRADVQPRQMQRSFSGGTSFGIASVDLKDDRLELKLDSRSGDSARLKLMLGKNWQSRMDVTGILQALSQSLTGLPQTDGHRSTSLAVIPSGKNGNTPVGLTSSAQSSVIQPAASISQQSGTQPGAASSVSYRRDPNATRVEGRISQEALQSIFAAFDQKNGEAFSGLSGDAASLSNSLLAFQKAYGGRPDYGSRALLQDISQLQDRLGKSLQARSDDDVVAMNKLFSRCVRFAQINQTRDEQGNLYGAGRNSSSFQQLFLSDAATGESVKVERDVEIERGQRKILDDAKTIIINIEKNLDTGALLQANQLYHQLSSDSQFAPVSQQYLQQTTSLQQDLASYVQAVQLDDQQPGAIVQRVQSLRKEVDLFNASASRPITANYLKNKIGTDAEALRQKIANLPTFQFDEASYSFPPRLSQTTSSNLNEKLTFVSARISDIDTKLASAAELRDVVTQPGATKVVQDFVGGNEAAELKRQGNLISAAEQVRASLVAEQQSLQVTQAKLAEDGQEKQRVKVAHQQAQSPQAGSSGGW